MLIKLISCSATLALAAALGGCATEVAFGGGGGEGGAGGGATTTTVAATTTTGVGGAPSTTTTGGGATCSGPNTAGPAAACTPQDVGCKPGQSACAAVEVVNGAPDFALKMTHVTFDKPAALASGVAKSFLENWLGPAPPICHIPNYLLAWILHFDLDAGTLTTGGARAGAGMAPGFQLIDDSAGSAPIVPVTGSLALGADCAIDATVGDVNVPVQYDPGSPGNIYLPFRSLRIHGGSVSPDHNCIGVYNEALLSPDNGCEPTPGVPAYTDGAEIDGFIRLEEADNAIIGVLQQSLCVFLSQDANTYGQQVDQYKLCARDANGQIVFQGDWCAATNQPAAPGCADAMRVHATFAASGVKLAN